MRDLCRSCEEYTGVKVMMSKVIGKEDTLVNYTVCDHCGIRKIINYTNYDILHLKEKLDISTEYYNECGHTLLSKYELSILRRKINSKIYKLQNKMSRLGFKK